MHYFVLICRRAKSKHPRAVQACFSKSLSPASARRKPVASGAGAGYSFLVTAGDFSDSALVLLAHGSTLNDSSGVPARLHAAELERRGWFSSVSACYWKQKPEVAGVLSALTARRVFIVPLFISEGYFSEQVIPSALGFRTGGGAAYSRVLQRGDRTLYYCPPVGSHPSMTGVLLARAHNVVSQSAFRPAPAPADMAMIVAGHGTAADPNSRRAVDRQVDLIRGRGLYGEVHAAFLEEEPRIVDCYGLTARDNLVVVPFFISDGLHTTEDIPVLLGEPEATVRDRLARGLPTWRNPTERHGKRLWYAPGIGSDPLIAEIILERVREAAAS